MQRLDDYMSIFEEGDRRALAPTNEQTSEMDLNVLVPDMPGYLQGLVVAQPHAQAAAMVAPTPQSARTDHTATPSAYSVVRATPQTARTAYTTAAPSYTVSSGTSGKQRVASALAPSPLFAINTNVPAVKPAESSPSSTSPSAGAPPPPPPDALPSPPPPDAAPPAVAPPTNLIVSMSAKVPPPPAPSGGGLGSLVLVAAVAGGLWWFFGRRDEQDRKQAMGVRGLADADSVRELELYMDNTESVYQLRKSFQENAARRMKGGTYDPEKAPKLWMYYVERGIKAYNREHGRGSMRLTRDEKMTLAKEYAREWEAEMQRAG